jgi:hypothetical protein
VETARWERIGAICGIVFVVLVLISFFTPSTPAIDDPIGEAIAEIADDETGILLGIYVGGLSAIAFLPFLGALWRLLRRRDEAASSPRPSWPAGSSRSPASSPRAGLARPWSRRSTRAMATRPSRR